MVLVEYRHLLQSSGLKIFISRLLLFSRRIRPGLDPSRARTRPGLLPEDPSWLQVVGLID